MGDTQIEPSEPWILVTNDDGVDSPALPPLLTALEGLQRVRTVAPARESSWSSKTLSRFARLQLRPAEDLPGTAWSLDGSPADCATVGVHNLCHAPPRLVISGINIGANAGLGFLLSSGTVGAAIEACLNGVPSLAFSVRLAPGVYGAWRASRDASPMADIWGRAAAVARQITDEVLDGGLPEGAQLMSVNLPQDVELDTPRVLTGVGDTLYGPFFRHADDGHLEHVFSDQRPIAPSPTDDLEVLARGQVSMTPIRFQLAVSPAPADRRRFERP